MEFVQLLTDSSDFLTTASPSKQERPVPRKVWQMPGTDSAEGELPVNPEGISASLGEHG